MDRINHSDTVVPNVAGHSMSCRDAAPGQDRLSYGQIGVDCDHLSAYAQSRLADSSKESRQM